MQPQTLVVSYILGFDVAGLHCKSEYSPETVKRKLNKLGAPRMTMELLHSRDPADEVIGWLRDISKFIQA